MSRLINDDELKKSIREQKLFVKWQKVLIETVIDDQPTVEVPTWIPCNERLPDSNMMCLVSVYSPKFIGDFVTKAGYLTDLAEWDPDQTEHISCWIVITEDFNYYILDNVVAWMPFPKPYEEEE